MRTPITAISSLTSHQSILTNQFDTAKTDFEAEHPGLDLDIDGLGRVSSQASDGKKCDACDCPTVVVWSNADGGPVRVCRNAVIAKKSNSLRQTDPFKIRIRQKVLRSSEGIPSGIAAVHMHVSEAQRQIDAGLMEFEGDELVIHDLIHPDDKHCPGCWRFTHPECYPSCPDLVQVPSP